MFAEWRLCRTKGPNKRIWIKFRNLHFMGHVRRVWAPKNLHSISVLPADFETTNIWRWVLCVESIGSSFIVKTLKELEWISQQYREIANSFLSCWKQSVLNWKSSGRSLPFPFKECCHSYVNRNSVTAIWAPLPYTYPANSWLDWEGMIKYSPYLGILQRTQCPFSS